MMRRHLPPLNGLRAFEAAARRESFKDAAEELNVTHSAVSHQIKSLEDRLGVQLFRRLGRGVRATAPARDLAEEIGKALDRMQAAIGNISGDPMHGDLHVSIAPFYGNRIVLPRLSRFHALYPQIRVVPDMSSTVIDFRKSELDCGLRYGRGRWPGLTSVAMHIDRLVPVAAPSVVAGRKLPLDPEEIAGLTLGFVEGDERDWDNWFAQLGYDALKPKNMLAYGNRARVIDLAFSGLGVALADAALTAADVAAGNLVQLHPATVDNDRAMWLVYPETEFPDPRVIAFGDWFKAEVDALLSA
jgi:LysR family glycine cleavage system transcriptional activator